MKALNSLSISSRALFRWHDSNTQLSQERGHPYALKEGMCLFRAPNLEAQDPLYFKTIEKVANNHNWHRGGDRRDRSRSKLPQKRNKWLPAAILAFSVGALTIPLSGDKWIDTKKWGIENGRPIEATLLAMAKVKETSIPLPSYVAPPAKQKSEIITKLYDHVWHKKIKTILHAHLDPASSHHNKMASDLDSIASYYSQYPNVRALIRSLKSNRWSLRYSEKTYETHVKGRALSIESMNVLFDPRSAAQFKFYNACTEKIPFCVASPADVLLHELIHVKNIIETPEIFIAQGGMNNVIYPFEHERKIIDEERALYQSMTVLDGLPRPLRSEHTGRHVLAACVTCLH